LTIGFIVLAGICAAILGGAILTVGFIALASTGVAVVGGAVLTPLLAVPMLGAIGFSAIGPVAGNGDPFHNSAVLSNSCSFPLHFSDAQPRSRLEFNL